jgi:hypothetical protein
VIRDLIGARSGGAYALTDQTRAGEELGTGAMRVYALADEPCSGSADPGWAGLPLSRVERKCYAQLEVFRF